MVNIHLRNKSKNLLEYCKIKVFKMIRKLSDTPLHIPTVEPVTSGDNILIYCRKKRIWKQAVL